MNNDLARRKNIWNFGIIFQQFTIDKKFENGCSNCNVKPGNVYVVTSKSAKWEELHQLTQFTCMYAEHVWKDPDVHICFVRIYCCDMPCKMVALWRPDRPFPIAIIIVERISDCFISFISVGIFYLIGFLSHWQNASDSFLKLREREHSNATPT